jgi:hypothetical protein
VTRTANIILSVVAVLGLVGGVALLVLAAHWAPSDPHHGQAVDGLDGIATFCSLLAGGGGLAVLAIGGFALRSVLRETRRL